MTQTPHVVVIGGGISGLAAAHALAGSGNVRVTVLEADRRLGGKIRSEPIGGHSIDVGAESLFARTPAALDLCRELGLDDLVGVAQTTTLVWTRNRLRELPSGILGGLPDGLGPVLRSGILSPLGLGRAALDLVLPARRTGGDRSVGELIRSRLGNQALDRLIDPLLGTIYAADCDRLSVRATAPQLDALARSHRSLIRGLRASTPPPPSTPSGRPSGTPSGTAPGRPSGTRTVAAGAQGGPLFMTLPGGLERIVTRLGEVLGEDVHTGVHVRRLKRAPDGSYLLETAGGEVLGADGMVLATPAAATASILSDACPAAAAELRSIASSSVIVVTMRYPASAAPRPLQGAGFLVPQSERRLLGACTWLSAKWPHLAATGELWLRCSVGRASTASALELDDADLVRRLEDELREAMGLRGEPLNTHVTRWESALPRYEPGHLDRIRSIESALAVLPGVALAGAAYRGMGVPQCIAQGQEAAQHVLTAISDRAQPCLGTI